MSSGPILIFDKSTLQSLSVDESCWLDNFYRANITPLFFVETLADLEKEIRSGRTPEQIVANIAQKTPITGALPNVYHLTLCIANLFGEYVEMRGVPVIGGGIPVTTADRKGIIFKQAPETEALQRWQRGEFLEVERRFARLWRRSLSNLDFEDAYREFRGLFGNAKPKTLAEVKSFIDGLTTDETRQSEMLAFALDLLGVPQELRINVFKRWVAEGLPPLPTFAPYAAYVFSVDLFFYVSIAADLISRDRPSNKIDLAYLYYLPFCMVFVSNDNLHIRTVPLFLNTDQTFVSGRELKSDLKLLDDYYSTLPDHIKDRGIMAFASYPPFGNTSLVTRLWDKYLPKWRTNADKESALELDKETQAKIIQQIKRFQEEARPADPATQIDSETADSVIFQRKVPARKGKWRIVSAEIERARKSRD